MKKMTILFVFAFLLSFTGCYVKRTVYVDPPGYAELVPMQIETQDEDAFIGEIEIQDDTIDANEEVSHFLAFCNEKAEVEQKGSYKQYYRHGGVKIEAKFNNGKPDGLFRIFYKHGGVKLQANYKEGALDGLVKSYYKSGGVKYSKEYREGEPTGIFKIYRRNGSVQEQISYE